MYNVSPFYSSDLFKLDLINLDYSTENYPIEYYLVNLYSHSQDCLTIKRKEEVLGYLIANHEYKIEEELNCHVTALSISPKARKNNLATLLMTLLKRNADNLNAKYIDLYVRVSNIKAINFYKKNNYIIHETVKDYYALPSEDAYDMRLYLNK